MKQFFALAVLSIIGIAMVNAEELTKPPGFITCAPLATGGFLCVKETGRGYTVPVCVIKVDGLGNWYGVKECDK